MAREKSQDKTELTNPALSITSHQVRLGKEQEKGRKRAGKGGKMLPVLLPSASQPLPSLSLMDSALGGSEVTSN